MRQGSQGRFLAPSFLARDQTRMLLPLQPEMSGSPANRQGCAASLGVGRVGLAFPGLFLKCRGPSVPAKALTWPGAFSCFLDHWAPVGRQANLQVAHLFKPRWCPESRNRA